MSTPQKALSGEGNVASAIEDVRVSRRQVTPLTERLLLDLPEDVIFLILGRCDLQSLGRLCRTCKKLQSLVQFDSVWLKFTKFRHVIGSSDPCHRYDRSNKSVKEQLRLSDNWYNKHCKEKVLFRNSTRLLPWMQFVNNELWISTRNVIQCFDMKILQSGRPNYCRPQEKKKKNIVLPTSHNTHDVTRFVVKGDTIVSGCRDGSLYIFDSKSGQNLQTLYQLHDMDTQAVDFHDNVIVSGSRDKMVKIISRDNTSDGHSDPIRAVIKLRERVWSLAMSQNQSQVTVGTSGCRRSPLSIWDLSRACRLCELGDYRHGAGVLDMKYEDAKTLLTCGYDATLRLWDLRSHTCVSEWPEPYDATLYSLQTDQNVTMVTGSAQHGMVRVWDKRASQSIQEYFFSQKSPVYSVVFDCHRLIAALDLSINFLDFSGFNA